MNRNDFMRQLENSLKHLPREAREEALSYYREYFDDAGPEKEAEVLEELGEPSIAASEILKQVAIKRLEEPQQAARKGLSTLWIIVLALCAAPIGLPFLLLTFGFGLATAVFFLTFFLALTLAGFLLTAIGVISIVAGIFFMPSQAANGIFILGAAFAEMGIGLLLILGCCLLFKWIFRGMAGLVKNMLARGGKK